MTNLCALLFACAALQSPSAAPAPAGPSTTPAPTVAPAKPEAKAEPEWIDLDRVVLIVNQDIITYQQMMSLWKREVTTRQINNPSEQQAAQNRVLDRRLRALLSAQAGQDMGADEKLVDRLVQDKFERMLANNNGVVGMSKIMQSQDLNTQYLKKEMREQLYAEVFVDSVTGEGAGLAERPNRDRYVRPGVMKFRYERALRNPELLRQIGGTTELVTLQMLVLDSDKNGGKDKTLELARELEQLIETGAEDMNDLVRRHGVNKVNDGVGEAFEIARLRQLDPPLAKFVDERPTDPTLWPKYIAEPFVVRESETQALVRIARIREITPSEIPALDSNKTQEQIAKQAQASLDDYRLDRAFAQLYKAAYIWPPEQAAPKEP